MSDITFGPEREGCDHVDMTLDGKLIGFRGLSSGKYGLTRCPSCNTENYSLAVLSGQCAWCGYDVKIHLGEQHEPNRSRS